MKPVNIQIIGKELAVKWDDGGEDCIPLKNLRQACPCAGCKGETDILGNLHKNPPKPYIANSFELIKFTRHAL